MYFNVCLSKYLQRVCLFFQTLCVWGEIELFSRSAVFVVALILHGLFARSTHCQHGKEVRVHSISSTNSRKSADCAIEEDVPSRATRYEFFTHFRSACVHICPSLFPLSKYTKRRDRERDEMPWRNKMHWLSKACRSASSKNYSQWALELWIVAVVCLG